MDLAALNQKYLKYLRLDYRVALLLASGCLAFLAAHFYPFLSDDALISLRYAERFIQGRGLTWDDYEKVEGYTNLLWVLLCSIPMKLEIGRASCREGA